MLLITLKIHKWIFYFADVYRYKRSCLWCWSYRRWCCDDKLSIWNLVEIVYKLNDCLLRLFAKWKAVNKDVIFVNKLLRCFAKILSLLTGCLQVEWYCLRCLHVVDSCWDVTTWKGCWECLQRYYSCWWCLQVVCKMIDDDNNLLMLLTTCWDC